MGANITDELIISLFDERNIPGLLAIYSDKNLENLKNLKNLKQGQVLEQLKEKVLGQLLEQLLEKGQGKVQEQEQVQEQVQEKGKVQEQGQVQEQGKEKTFGDVLIKIKPIIMNITQGEKDENDEKFKKYEADLGVAHVLSLETTDYYSTTENISKKTTTTTTPTTTPTTPIKPTPLQEFAIKAIKGNIEQINPKYDEIETLKRPIFQNTPSPTIYKTYTDDEIYELIIDDILVEEMNNYLVTENFNGSGTKKGVIPLILDNITTNLRVALVLAHNHDISDDSPQKMLPNLVRKLEEFLDRSKNIEDLDKENLLRYFQEVYSDVTQTIPSFQDVCKRIVKSPLKTPPYTLITGKGGSKKTKKPVTRSSS